MGTPNIISNLTAGNNQAAQAGIQKVGIPVTNNAGPSMAAAPASSPLMHNLTDPTANPYMPAGTTPLSTTGAVPPAAAIPTASSTPGTNPLNGVNQGNLNKQLTDTFGKGEGGLLNSVINNLGSNNSSYMQAYNAAMAPQNAEDLATLNTTLGNEGVSGNSSTAAIANADFQSRVSANQGLQEQQLQMQDLNQLVNLTQGLQQPSAAEVASGGFMNYLGAITTDAGALLHGGSGATSVPGGFSGGASASSPAAMQLSNSALMDTSGAGQAIPTQASSLNTLL